MSGELKNIPVSGLLQDLLQGREFSCKVDGALPGSISIGFDNLTAEEVIRKIMRNLNYDYTLIVNGPGTKDEGVSELTIYRGASIVRFTRVAPEHGRRAAPPAGPRDSASGNSVAGVSDAETVINMEQVDRKIKEFMDEMLASKKISRAEYARALKEVMGSDP